MKYVSKFTYYDFRCETCKTKWQTLVKPDVYTIPCVACGKPAKRLISAPTISLPGTDPAFPGAYDKWEKKQRTKQAEDKKFHDEHGSDKKHHSYGS